MCTTQPGIRHNNTISLRESSRFSNRKNSYLPTPRKWVDSEVIAHPIRMINDEAFANELVPTKGDV